MPDGAKFCPSCGTLTAKAEANKSFCANCGLELPKGAKFCTVCGAAVASKANIEIKPSDVLSPVTPSEPISVSPAVVLDKTPDESPVSVSEVKINAEPAYSIPTPASDASMPAIDSETAKKDSEPNILDQIEFGYVSESPVIEEAPVLEEVPVMPETPVMPVMPEAPVISETPAPEAAPVMPETPAMTAPTGYSSAAASYSAPSPTYTAAPTPAPAYTPSPNNQMENPFGDYGMGAAAVATKPIKKKSVLKPILIAVGSLLGAALIAAGVLFFVNKSLLFNIVLGNSGYAGMVEGNSIREVTDKIDFNAMSQSIKSATNSASSLLTSQFSGLSSIVSTTGVTPMMASNVYGSSVDFSTFVKSIGETMRDAYGANSAKISIDLGAELTDTGLSQLSSAMNCSKKDIEEVLKLINQSNISVDVSADEKAFESGIEFSNGSLKLNAKAVITEDGNAYLVLPFVSEKSLMLKVGSGYTASAGQVSDVYLEIDEKELKRITEKLVSIYIDVYKSSEITVKDGEISVAGVTAKGKYITAKLNGEKIAEIIWKIGESFANDNYLCEKIAKFLNDCGLPITAEQLQKSLQSMFNTDSYQKMVNGSKLSLGNVEMVIETVTDNSCRVLAKSYSFGESGKSSVKISAVGDLNLSTKTGNTAALAIEADGQTLVSALFEKSSDTDGVCTVNANIDNNKFSIKVKYSGVKQTTFRGKTTAEGTYEISFVLPADFTQTGNSAEIYSILGSAKIVMSVKIENENTVKETVSFEIPQYGKLSADATLTVEDKSNGVSIPSDVLDISAVADSNGNEIPESLKKDIISYLKDMKNAVNSQNAGNLGDLIVESLDNAIDLAENGPSADSDDISDLLLSIEEEKSEIIQFDEMYQNEDEALSLKAEELVKKYERLSSSITDKIFDMTQKEFDGFRNTLATLTAEKDALQKEYESVNPQFPNITNGSKAEEIDFMSLEHREVSLLYAEYYARFEAVVMKNYELLQNDSRIYALAEEASDAYEKATEDYNNFYDVLKADNLNLSLLRKYRKSTQAFALAVEALEDATATVV